MIDKICTLKRQHFSSQKMKQTIKILHFVYVFILYQGHVSGMETSIRGKLDVNILDGEVIVLWEHLENITSDFWYNVQMAKYGKEWNNISSCMKITQTYCDITKLIQDFGTKYKVRVKLFTPDNQFDLGLIKTFHPIESDLLPPSFTLRVTASTLTVYIHEKPILKKLFPYGVNYIIYLEEIGQANRTTKVYLEDSTVVHETTKTFTDLHWGTEYCVAAEVEGKGALKFSNRSEKRCVQLPEQEWYVMAVSSLATLCVLVTIAVLGAVVFCYVTHPANPPAALKSAVIGWNPLIVTEGPAEVVTDKGWFLSSYKPEMKNSIKLTTDHWDMKETKEIDELVASSWASMETNSASHHQITQAPKQEDSGCGSMMGSENSTGSQTEYPITDEKFKVNPIRKREDSGVGLGSQLEFSSVITDGQDNEPVPEAVRGSSYLSQLPSAVQNQLCEGENVSLGQIPAETGPLLPAWCPKYNQCQNETSSQSSVEFIESEHLEDNNDLKKPYKRAIAGSGYTSKSQKDSLAIQKAVTTILQMNETFPMLSSLPVVSCAQVAHMNSVPISLCDVHLITD